MLELSLYRRRRTVLDLKLLNVVADRRRLFFGDAKDNFHYLRRGGCFRVVCVSVCKISQKVMSGF